jgi:hypothetical protein
MRIGVEMKGVCCPIPGRRFRGFGGMFLGCGGFGEGKVVIRRGAGKGKEVVRRGGRG